MMIVRTVQSELQTNNALAIHGIDQTTLAQPIIEKRPIYVI